MKKGKGDGSMNLRTIALKNLKRNFSFYSLYLFSVSLVLMIFFCFTSFSMNEVIMENISSDGRVETMCQFVSMLVMAFVIFYMSYSNKFFMRRRMKELGVYTLLGYRKTAMLKLLTFETTFICLGGLFVGILLGSLLHKGLTAGIVALLGLAVDNSRIPLINFEAVKFSVLFVFVVLLALVFSNMNILRKATLMDMVRMEKKIEKPIRVHLLPALAGILSLSCGYALAVDMVRGKQSVWYSIGFSPIALLTLLLVVVGTVLFIFSFLPFACNWIKRNHKLLYRENTIIVAPKFMHRIRSNAQSLILIILLSAGTLSILGATVLSVWYPLEALERIIPSAIEFRAGDDAVKENAITALDQAIGAENYGSYETTLLQIEAISDHLPLEYNISADNGRVPGFECMNLTDYCALMDLQKKDPAFTLLDDRECILIKYRPDEKKSDVGAVYTLKVGHDPVIDVIVKDTSLQNPIGFGNSVGTLVVSDEVYQSLLAAHPASFKVVSMNGNGLRTNVTAYQAVSKMLPDNPYLVSAWYRQNELVRENSSTLLLICFATIIFLVATGSILYFQNVSSVTYDKPDYEIMEKMGYNASMIKRTLRHQIKIYFLIPYVMGVLHSIFALICYKSALMDELLGKSSAVLVPILFSIVVFSLIYLLYYLVTKRSCYKIVM